MVRAAAIALLGVMLRQGLVRTPREIILRGMMLFSQEASVSAVRLIIGADCDS